LSQEYTEDKEVSLTPLSSGRRLLEALLILVTLFAVYLMVSLVTFNPSDPSWSQTAWHEPIHNLGGRPGAWLADTLLFIFGVMAYAIPVVIVGLCWISLHLRQNKDYIDCFAIGLRLIGVLALVITTCGLAAINADDIWYFASGGVIGSLVSSAMDPWFTQVTSTLILLCVWAIGVTLYTGWSWLTIAEKIGGVVMSVLTFASNRSRHDEHWHDDNADDELASASSSADHEDPLLSTPKGRRRLLSRRKPTSEDQDPLFSMPADANEAADPLFSRSTFTAVDESDPLLAPRPTDAVHSAPITAVPAASVAASDFTTSPVAQSAYTVPEAYAAPGISTPAVSTPVPRSAETVNPVEPPVYHFEVPSNQPVPPQTSEPAQRPIATQPQYASAPAATEPAARRYVETSSPVATTPSQPQTSTPRPEVDNISAAARPQTVPSGSQPASAAAQSQPQMQTTPASKPAGQSPFAVAASMGKLQNASTSFESAGRHPSPQVKQGVGGPELPRPNPVRLPTRREMASYGIKLPSQRLAEEKAREEQQRQTEAVSEDVDDFSAVTSQEDDGFDQRHLRQAFAEQQKARYGDHHQTISAEEEDEDQQAALARQFAEQQQQRYQSVTVTPDPVAPASVTTEQPAPVADPPVFDFVPEAPVSAPQSPSFNAPQSPISVNATATEASAPAWQAHQEHPDVAGYAAEQSSSQSAAQPADYAVRPQATTSAPATEQTARPAATETVAAADPQQSLFHPFLVRHEQPLEKPSTPLPTMDLLTPPPVEEEPVDMFALEQTGQLVEARLNDFRVKAEVVGISPGPVITRFELDLAPGVKAARISNLSRDLARSLSAVAVRIVEVIPGKPYVGLELPNKHRQTVYLREVLDCAKFRDNPSPLAIVLGKDIAGQPVVADLAKMPHLLVAGTTGSGKSVGVNAMIISMLYKATPDEVRFIMIDPKMLELSVYEGIPHLLTEVVTDMKDAANALRWSVGEMERRYKLMSALGVRNLAGYNEKIEQAEAMGRPIPDPFWKPGDSMDTTPPVLEKLPYIVVLVDEFADLMMAVGKKVEELIARLAQKARAAGIHLVLATQRPSVDVITGLIKANIPTRIAFTVSSKIDSRTILDQGGAESLLGMGDMLYVPPNSSMPIRVHGAFVRDQEVHAVVQDWKARGRPQYIDSITAGDDNEGGAGGAEGNGEELDPLFDQAVGFVVEKRRASISGVQRQFRIGYNRAARIIEQMEAQGIVSEPGHNGNREVLSPPPHEL